jgi:hypothetical protein
MLFVGCSFTNGMELQDKQVSRFSAIVSKEFGYNQWNEGKVGAGNDYIQRTVFNSVINNQLFYNTPLQTLGVKKHKYETRVKTKGDYIEKFMWEDKTKEGNYQQTFQQSKTECGRVLTVTKYLENPTLQTLGVGLLTLGHASA